MSTIHAVPDQPDRIAVNYTCPSDHEFSKVFAADIDIPATWDCPRCGKMATTGSQTAAPEETPANESRTPWDMLMERRTIDTLTDMLTERVKQQEG